MQQMLQCYKCGSQNVLGQQFCTVCGERFQYRCPQCSADIKPGSSFCPGCAVELNWGVPQQATTISEEVKVVDHEKEGEYKLAKVNRGISPQWKKTSPWLIAFIVIVLCIVAVFIIDMFLK